METSLTHTSPLVITGKWDEVFCRLDHWDVVSKFCEGVYGQTSEKAQVSCGSHPQKLHTWCGWKEGKSNSSTISTATQTTDSMTARMNSGRSWVGATASRPWSWIQKESTDANSGTPLIGPKFPSGILHKPHETRDTAGDRRMQARPKNNRAGSRTQKGWAHGPSATSHSIKSGSIHDQLARTTTLQAEGHQG